MKLISLGVLGAAAMAVPLTGTAADRLMVATDAYRWQGDTVYQNEFKAWADSPYKISSTYKGRPGFFMPVEQTWEKKNDLSSYPVLTTDNLLHTAIYNLGLDEMVNAVEPDTTLRTGKEWAGVWTRDVSYSIILSMAALQPEASMISLMKKVNPEGQIIQDTGSGGAWPVSTDRMIWVVAAWELYKVTGDRQWLEKVYPIAVRSLQKDEKTIFSPNGLVKGETSFIDWREQSYPKWMQTVDISQSEAMGTNALYVAALKCTAEMATVLGKKKEAAEYTQKADRMAETMERVFNIPDKGYWGMYTYGRDNKILNPRAETLGSAISILYDVASPERIKTMSESNPVTPYGVAVFYPQISDMPSYHNNALWPFVGAYWALAQAKAGNEQGVVESIGSIFRPAALFTTNKENLNLDNGDYYTELNSSNMLWCLSGNLALTNQILFGIHYEKDGLLIKPFVPEVFAGNRTLSNYPYRGGRLTIEVEGYGAKVAALYLDGKKVDPDKVIPAVKLKGDHTIKAVMDNQPIPAMNINRQPNRKAPWTPVVRLETNPADGGSILSWDPIEYIAGYIVLKDGKEYKRTRATSLPLTEAGEWQVIGVSGDGIESFASVPVSNREMTDYKPAGLVVRPQSSEVSYQPAGEIEGFYGAGFAETDRNSGALDVEIDVDTPGEYAVEYIYANGNGPVNTENKCAIRTLMIDGEKAGTIVMPTRGVANWSDWGLTNSVTVTLTPGKHVVTLEYLPEDSNMNIATNHALIDRLRITRK